MIQPFSCLIAKHEILMYKWVHICEAIKKIILLKISYVNEHEIIKIK
jgi:hypothetical protein